MKFYKHIFFDLDRTLWDFDKNAHEAFCDIFGKHGLEGRGGLTLDRFVERYIAHNERLWALYRDGKIEKQNLRWHRFEATLKDFGIEDTSLAQAIGDDYVNISPTKVNLLPNTVAALDYLRNKYTLHIITNGFEEVQFTKLKNSDLRQYFQHVITSESAGCKKPNPDIFAFALRLAAAQPEESLMIGDDIETDIKGAALSGMDAIYFNPGNVPHNGGVNLEIDDLIKLTQIL